MTNDARARAELRRHQLSALVKIVANWLPGATI
jgi:hypothetical protein